MRPVSGPYRLNRRSINTWRYINILMLRERHQHVQTIEYIPVLQKIVLLFFAVVVKIGKARAATIHCQDCA